MEDVLVCPQAWKWSQIYRSLEHAYEEHHGEGIPAPPEMLPPGAGISALRNRWQDTVDWANEHGYSHLIPVLKEEEEFFVHN